MYQFDVHYTGFFLIYLVKIIRGLLSEGYDRGEAAIRFPPGSHPA